MSALAGWDETDVEIRVSAIGWGEKRGIHGEPEPDDTERLMVLGFTSPLVPGLAVTYGNGGFDGFWKITHLATGYGVTKREYESASDAATVALQIAPLADWTLSRERMIETLTPPILAQLKSILRPEEVEDDGCSSTQNGGTEE